MNRRNEMRMTFSDVERLPPTRWKLIYLHIMDHDVNSDLHEPNDYVIDFG